MSEVKNVLPFPRAAQKPLFEAIHVSIPLASIETHVNFVQVAAVFLGNTPERATEVLNVLTDDDVRQFRRELLGTARCLLDWVRVVRAVRYRCMLCRPLPNDGPEEGPSAA